MTVSDQMFPKRVISEHLLVAYSKLTDIIVMSPAHSQLLKCIKEATKIIDKYHPSSYQQLLLYQNCNSISEST